jgi:hypothetical protein
MVRLPDQRSADRLPTFPVIVFLLASIDPLNKGDAPLILEVYIYLLSVQCLVSLSKGLTRNKFSLYNTLAAQKPPMGSTEPMHAQDPLDPMTLPETMPARTGLQTVHAMLNSGSRFL